ncbi:Ig-like domain-containing protein [Plantactinospora sonchi]|uniref:VCBS repeat-containing protein n=1 Tax=Plantactinospora sonchi TaxID=1544735 RepID=A0ABU7RMR3_9ACTN
MWRKPVAAVAVTATLITVGLMLTPAASAAGPGELFFGDLNGDGVRDRLRLGTAPPRACAVAVEFGTAEGGFLAPRRYPYLPLGSPAAIRCPSLGVAVDLDPPVAGTPAVDELVVGWYGGHPWGAEENLVVLRNLTPVDQVRAPRRPNHLGLADFDGDRRPDLYVWTDQGDGFATFLNPGIGTLRAGPVRYCAALVQHRLADFDRNGATDVALAYLERCADSSRGVAVVLDDGTLVELQGAVDDRSGWTLHVLNADRNGVPDVVTYHVPSGERRTFLATGTGAFVVSPLAVQDTFTVARVGPTPVPVQVNDWVTRRARIEIVTPPTAGTLRVTDGRYVEYLPGPDPGVADQFVYRIDQDGRSSTASVLIKIPTT